VSEDAFVRRLRWQCRRGHLELDLLLRAFLDRHLGELNNDERQALARLLSYPDETLWSWLHGTESVTDRELAALVERIR
jgi:antitoxin CptB